MMRVDPLVAHALHHRSITPAYASGAIVVGFGVTEQALFEVALGLHEPQGRLPITFPASMDAVEAQLEDVGDDTAPYVDATGNAYAFGFGLNWSGVIGG